MVRFNLYLGYGRNYNQMETYGQTALTISDAWFGTNGFLQVKYWKIACIRSPWLNSQYKFDCFS